MTPTLIVIALSILAVGIVVWATHRNSRQPHTEPLDQDVTWNDPLTPAPKHEPPHPEDRPKA